MYKIALAFLAGAYLALCAVSAVGIPCKPTKETGHHDRARDKARIEQAYAAGYAAAVADGNGVDVEAGKP